MSKGNVLHSWVQTQNLLVTSDVTRSLVAFYDDTYMWGGRRRSLVVYVGVKAGDVQEMYVHWNNYYKIWRQLELAKAT